MRTIIISIVKSTAAALAAASVVFLGYVLGHAHQAKVIGAFLVGMFGSAAYITALYFKFVGTDDPRRSIILQPFLKSGQSEEISLWNCLWYTLVGGGVAAIFQWDVPNFVAIQNLIIGATWPAIVSQFLSGRMVSPTDSEVQQFLDKIGKSATPATKQVRDSIEAAVKNIKTEIQQRATQ